MVENESFVYYKCCLKVENARKEEEYKDKKIYLLI